MNTATRPSLFVALFIALVTVSPAIGAQTPSTVAPAATPVAPIPFAASNLTPLGVRALAANCAACHGTNGSSAGGAIPGLAGGNKDYFVAQLKAFKEGKREATVMHQIAKGYSDAEIIAIGDFFAAQKK
jgi:cytochrome c553